MTVGWQKVQVPVLERLALADMAQRRGEKEEETLAAIIRDAVRRECATDAQDTHKKEAIEHGQ